MEHLTEVNAKRHALEVSNSMVIDKMHARHVWLVITSAPER